QGLVEVEEHLQYARRFYNGAVREYNDATQRVPDVLVARLAGFRPEDFFEAGEAQRAAVRVELPCTRSASPCPRRSCRGCWPGRRRRPRPGPPEPSTSRS